jgi:hypothetical protein
MALEAAYKRVEAEEMSKDEARGEDTTKMRDSQECILSGGVYLRHRLEKQDLKDILLCFPHVNTIPHQLPACNLRRSGVLACKKLSLSLTRIPHTFYIYLVNKVKSEQVLGLRVTNQRQE